MAKMIENVLVLKVSKLVRDTDTQEQVVTEDIQLALEQVTKELAGTDVLVEIEQL